MDHHANAIREAHAALARAGDHSTGILADKIDALASRLRVAEGQRDGYWRRLCAAENKADTLTADNGELRARVASLEYLRRKDEETHKPGGPLSPQAFVDAVRDVLARGDKVKDTAVTLRWLIEDAGPSIDRLGYGMPPADPWALPEGLSWGQLADGSWVVTRGANVVASRRADGVNMFMVASDKCSLAGAIEALRLCMERNRSQSECDCRAAWPQEPCPKCGRVLLPKTTSTEREVWEPVKLNDIELGHTVRTPTTVGSYHVGRVTKYDEERCLVFLDGVAFDTTTAPGSWERRR